MSTVVNILSGFGNFWLLFIRSAGHLGSLPRQYPRFVEQCYLIGYTSLPIVAILSFFIGSVLALQTGHSLQGFGAQEYIGAIVGLSMARELAPVMASILLAGRVGSAITAELASMKVYQEVDALVTMNIPPERILVMPRLAAVLVMMPVLTIVANIVGWFGGAVICQYVAFIGIDSQIYFQGLSRNVEFIDVLAGLIKAEIFGFCIVMVCCQTGLQTTGGPREIGIAVTRAVVLSLILILILDYFVTRVLMTVL